ncbi:Hypothetical protein D9617_14g077130 [Elsinoe fawcettii]|nr:Hypothetical protein D9617_14g077130 [Elsinoe fawcettii]
MSTITTTTIQPPDTEPARLQAENAAFRTGIKSFCSTIPKAFDAHRAEVADLEAQIARLTSFQDACLAHRDVEVAAIARDEAEGVFLPVAALELREALKEQLALVAEVRRDASLVRERNEALEEHLRVQGEQGREMELVVLRLSSEVAKLRVREGVRERDTGHLSGLVWRLRRRVAELGMKEGDITEDDEDDSTQDGGEDSKERSDAEDEQDSGVERDEDSEEGSEEDSEEDDGAASD